MNVSQVTSTIDITEFGAATNSGIDFDPIIGSTNRCQVVTAEELCNIHILCTFTFTVNRNPHLAGNSTGSIATSKQLVYLTSVNLQVSSACAYISCGNLTVSTSKYAVKTSAIHNGDHT